MKKKIREKGKVKLSRMFQELKPGDRVTIVRELSVKVGFPERIKGKTGLIEGKRGKAYIVRIKDYNEEKKFIVNSIHLKKIK